MTKNEVHEKTCTEPVEVKRPSWATNSSLRKATRDEKQASSWENACFAFNHDTIFPHFPHFFRDRRGSQRKSAPEDDVRGAYGEMVFVNALLGGFMPLNLSTI